jgi:hypothetical protein
MKKPQRPATFSESLSPSVATFHLPTLSLEVRRDAPFEVTHKAGFPQHFFCLHESTSAGEVVMAAGRARQTQGIVMGAASLVSAGTPFTCGWTAETNTTSVFVPPHQLEDALEVLSDRHAGEVVVRQDLEARDARLNWLARALREYPSAEAYPSRRPCSAGECRLRGA